MGYFASAKRSYLQKKNSFELLQKNTDLINFWKLKDKYQTIRLPNIFNFRRFSSKTNPTKGIKGSNMAFWRDDLLHVNGYNEDLEMWGFEDKEIAARLINSGILKQRVRYKCISYHIYHKEAPRTNLQHHAKVLNKVLINKTVKCLNGIHKTKKIDCVEATNKVQTNTMVHPKS